ncbi:hypothetical protein LY474_36260 [Myxococcus stipitatus]|uniref:hypothetical protein n=1 Tax=Myxococcus stipitatus TaxID=83455 RepID=UPI001F1B124C|nr:hypothetical protein [Myxococcus stipitatus]MCE9673276.1 hypothetical protein [Myxococcus stipitatus]
MHRATLVALGLLLLGAVAHATPPARTAPPPRKVQTAAPPPVATQAADMAEADAATVEAAVAPVSTTDASGAKVMRGYRVSSASAETETEGSLRATFSLTALRPPIGYTSFQVVLNNTGSVPLPARVSYRSPVSDPPRTISRSVEVGPRQRVVVWLPVPESLSTGDLTVTSPDLPPIRRHVYADDSRDSALLVLGTSEPFVKATGLVEAGEQDEPHFAARFLEAGDAPRELASYVGFDAVVVTMSPLELPSDLWATLESYLLAGGRLVFTRYDERGLREHLPLLSEGLPRPPATYAFGQVWWCDAREPAVSCLAMILDLLKGEPETAEGVVSPMSLSQSERRGRISVLEGGAPLLGRARASMGGLFVFMLAFVAAVGPGAWMLARRRGPVAVLVAIPSVSLLTCLLLVAWSVVRDGFATYTARYSMTWLDDARARAVTLGVGAWYANLSLDSVRLPGTTVLVSPAQVASETADLDWTNGLELGAGFLPARTYREWGEVTVQPTRVRLVVRADGRVQNALGAPLEGGLVRWEGALRKLPSLADGEEGVLGEPVEEEEDGDAVDGLVDQHLSSGLFVRLSHDKHSFRSNLPEGGFVAVLRGPGPLPTSAIEMTLEAGVHLVRGTVREDKP